MEYQLYIYILLFLLVGNLFILDYGVRQSRKRKKEILNKENIIKEMLSKLEYTEGIIATYKKTNEEVLDGYIRMVQLSISPKKNKYKNFLLDYNKIMYNCDEEFTFSWDLFCRLLNNAHNNYIDKLNSDFGFLTDKEIQVIAMQKAGFDLAQIAEILEYSINTIYKRNSNIRKKMEIPESGSIIDFIDQVFS